MTGGLFISDFDVVAPGSRLRRLAKYRVPYWQACVRRWLHTKGRTESTRLARGFRSSVNAGGVTLCRSWEPADGSLETFVWLWPEHLLRNARKTPIACSLTQPGSTVSGRSYEGTERLARYLAVREAAAAAAALWGYQK